MTESRSGRTLLAITAALLLPACAGSAGGGAGASEEAAPSAAELEAIYLARVDSARMRFTEADVRFMTQMIEHHAQALEMAQLAPTHGADPQVQILAARIVNAQTDEIATMRRWLQDRGQPVPEAGGSSGAPMAHGAHHTMQMPGMVSPEQMRALEQARGTKFDRLFLSLMIEHHEGAVTMVRELFRTDGAAQDAEVFKFASDAQVDQATEVDRMKLMLSRLPDAPPGG